MSTESQNGNESGQQQGVNPAVVADQSQSQNGVATQQEVPHVFDQDFTLPGDDDDFLPINFDDDEGNHHHQEQAPEGDQSQNQNEQGAQKEQSQNQEITFDDEAKAPEGTTQSDEDLIAKLKEKGYDIQKPEEVSEQENQNQEIQRLQGVISQSNDFIQSDDKVVITEKEKNILINDYKNSGKEHLVGTEEFNLELEGSVEEIMSNPATSRIYAENVRRDVKDWIKENQDKHDGIKSEIDRTHSEKVSANRTNLQNSLKDLHKNGFLNQDVSPEDVQEAYKSITSGEFSKQINNSPELVAKFALFLRKENKISEHAGKPTYGEGVKDAIDGIHDSSKKSTTSPLAQGLSKHSNSSGQEVKDVVKRFGESNVISQTENSENNDKKYVAGSSRF